MERAGPSLREVFLRTQAAMAFRNFCSDVPDTSLSPTEFSVTMLSGTYFLIVLLLPKQVLAQKICFDAKIDLSTFCVVAPSLFFQLVYKKCLRWISWSWHPKYVTYFLYKNSTDLDHHLGSAQQNCEFLCHIKTTAETTASNITKRKLVSAQCFQYFVSMQQGPFESHGKWGQHCLKIIIISGRH